MTPSRPQTGTLPAHHPFRRRIISGVLVVVPLVITIWVLRFLFGILGNVLMPIISAAFFFLPQWAVWCISVVAFIGLIYTVGAIAGHVLGRKMISWAESWLLRTPLINPIYSTIRQVIETVLISDGVSFKSVVLVNFPLEGALSIGFVTGTIRHGKKTLNKVFVPTTPNPTSGFLIIVPVDRCQLTSLTVEEGIRYVVSAGILAIDDLDRILVTSQTASQEAEHAPDQNNIAPHTAA